ncbi:four helix bundle protein [Ferruginibacter sp. HRS2-29]|uniref:four helix bundle protein n=1 Tax=Ferruginibacter sp. HRS2-29 TaxID=2487334 RepID=UPI0020CF7B7B|nr:four helix bundle protein [Ferruginibacter sp. HRS2-29]MCP9753093.1 four helix bundle protein [Ferruginibacter sp. HRS2-29]
MKANIIREKSFAFSVRIVHASKYLQCELKEYILSRQLLRSGTSIGANIGEAIGAQSKADFLHKLTIAYKEARETLYWIRLLLSTSYFTNNIAESLLKDGEEICKIIGAIQKTTREHLKLPNS